MSAERAKAYRARKRASDLKSALVMLPADLMRQVDGHKERNGFQSRSEALADLLNTQFGDDQTKHSAA